MTLKNQFKKIKENWLLLAIFVVLLLVVSFGNTSFVPFDGGMIKGGYFEESFMADSVAANYGTRSYMAESADFAPEIEERKIVRTASINNEIDRGEFSQAQTDLKQLVSLSDALITNENVGTSGNGKKAAQYGTYQIRVEVGHYDEFVSELKEIGEVKSFNENVLDITGQYDNNQINLEVEQERLARYLELYEEAEDVEERLNLADRIFDQERRVKYLTDALDNLDQRIEYTTVSVSLREKSSEYTNIAFVKFSQLVRNFVSSFNSLISFVVSILPWALLVGGIWLVWRRVKSR